MVASDEVGNIVYHFVYSTYGELYAVKDGDGNSQSLNRFCYVQGNSVSLTDPFGLCPDGNGLAEVFMQQTASIMGLASSVMETGATDKRSFWHTALDLIGIVWDGADIINTM